MFDRLNKSSNPMMKKFDTEKTQFQVNYSDTEVLDAPESIGLENQMTLNGTLNKTMLLIGLMVLSAFFTAYALPISNGILMGSIGIGFVLAMVISFKPTLAPTLSPLYAMVKGIVVGIASVIYGSMFNGIVPIAAIATITVLFSMLMIYRSGLIKVTQKFRMVVGGATMGIIGMYLIVYVLRLFGVEAGGFLFAGDWFSIGLSIVIIIVASLNFLLDFDMIENGVRSGSPKYMEWFGGFALLVTLVWLYLEILRLIAMLASND